MLASLRSSTVKVKASDILLSVLALLAVIVVNNDISVVRSKGVGDIYPYPYPYPYVMSIFRTYPSPSDAPKVEFEVTFSEQVTGVDASDFSLTTTGLTGASILRPYSYDAFHYIVEVDAGSGVDGTVRLDLDDNDSILSLGDVPHGGVGVDNGSYSNGEVYVVDRSAPPSNNDFASAEKVLSSNYSDEIYTYGATLAGDDPVIGSCGIGQGVAIVWYEYTPSVDTAISIDTSGADYDTFIAVWTGPDKNNLNLIACNDDVNGTKQSALALKVQQDVIYDSSEKS